MEFIIGMLAFLSMMTGLRSTIADAGVPSIQFDSLSKDLGKITQGEIATHTFSFTNKGGGILEIASVEPA